MFVWVQSRLSPSDKEERYGTMRATVRVPSVSCEACGDTWWRGLLHNVELNEELSLELKTPSVSPAEFVAIQRAVSREAVGREILPGDRFPPLLWNGTFGASPVGWPADFFGGQGLILSGAAAARVRGAVERPILVSVVDSELKRGAFLMTDDYRGGQFLVESCSVCHRQKLFLDVERKRLDRNLRRTSSLPRSEIGSDPMFKHSAYSGFIMSNDLVTALGFWEDPEVACVPLSVVE